jgi:type I restriction enzyme R subunit
VSNGGAQAYLTPEARARIDIDAQLEAAGWVIQDYRAMNLAATAPGGTVPGVAVREFPLKSGHGVADYLVFVNRQAVGVLEAKRSVPP